jgi:hypothetical protein
VKKEKDHHSFSDSVTADADRKGGGAEYKDEDQAGEGVVDGEIQGAGEKSGAGKAEEMDGDSYGDGGHGEPTSMHGVAKAVKEIDQDGSTGEIFGYG